MFFLGKKVKYLLFGIFILSLFLGAYFLLRREISFSPRNLSCTIEDFAIKLSWEISSAKKKKLTFRVYRKSPFEKRFSLLADNLSDTAFHDKTPLDPYLSYSYYVTAVFDEKESLPSNIVSCQIHKTSKETLAILKNFYAKAEKVKPDPAFTPEKLLFDADFINQKAMTVEEIQKFLEEKNSILATIDPKRLCGGDPKHCDNEKTAAELIYEAANLKIGNRDFGINPAVILVILQKEQGLITWTPEDGEIKNGISLQDALDWAMGYAVFENGKRIEALKGFRNQLLGAVDENGVFWWGAVQSLRNNFELGRGPNTDKNCKGYGKDAIYPSYFNGNCNEFELINSTNYFDVPLFQKVKPKNRATMALYRYTPHVFNGNYNFWYLWNYWFGSIYNVETLTQMNLNSSLLVEGNVLKVNFKIKNKNKIRMEISRLKVDVRAKNLPPQDIYGISKLVLSPGEIFEFSSPKVKDFTILTSPGKYTLSVKVRYKGKWYTLSGSKPKTISVREIKPEDISLSSPLSLNKTTLFEGEKIKATFKVKNNTSAPIFLERLKVDIRGKNGAFDILGYSKEIIKESLTFTKNNSRALKKAGDYFSYVAVKINGKWLLPKGNVKKRILVKPAFLGVSLFSPLSLNALSFVEGNKLKASFKIKNNSSAFVFLSRLKVDVRAKNLPPQDIYGISKLVLSPGEIFEFSSPKVKDFTILTSPGKYTLSVKVRYKGKWYTLSGSKPKTISVREIKPEDISLSSPLSLNKTTLFEGEKIKATFKVKNNTSAPIFLERLKVDIRGKNGAFDILGKSKIWLENEISLTENNERIIKNAGDYTAQVKIKVNKKWLSPSGSKKLSISVKTR